MLVDNAGISSNESTELHEKSSSGFLITSKSSDDITEIDSEFLNKFSIF